MKRSSRPLSLRTQLVAGFVLVAVLTTVLVALSAVWLTREAMIGDATDRALAALRADLVLAGQRVNERAVQVEAEDGLPRRLLSDLDLHELGEELTMALDGDSAILLEQPADGGHFTGHLPVAATDVSGELRSIVAGGMLGQVRQERDGRVELVVGGRVASDALSIYRVVDLQAIDDELGAVTGTLARAGALPIVSALLVGLLAARRVLRPVRRARDAARHLGDGDLDTRLAVRGNDEFADLSRSFNEMAASLQATVDELRAMEAQQRRFVADVSHELRTPLTALVAAVEVLEDELAEPAADGGLGVPEDRRLATLLAIDEVRAMRELVEDLIVITRFDAGRAQLDAVPTRVAAAVTATLRRRDHLGRVTVSIADDLVALVDPRRLDTVVANLVGNALTHGQEPVTIRASRGGDGADDLLVEVEDSGPGMPEELRDRLFERFSRGDQARTRSGSSGLGLAIARENARLHGGELELAATGPDGTVMRCSLPGRVLDGAAPPTRDTDRAGHHAADLQVPS